MAKPNGEATYPSTSIIFAFDSGYLEPFKVLLHSMSRIGTLADSPIIIHTDDPRLQEDRVIQAVADEVSLIEGKVRERLHFLARNTISRKGRTDWDRGTFLKWSSFRPCGTEQALFLDVDMLCLKPLEGFVGRASEADLVACPQFQTSLRQDAEGNQLPGRKLRARLHKMLAGQFDKVHRSRINSGVMLLKKPVLSNEFFEAAAAHAETAQAVNEQSHLSRLFKNGEYEMELVSASYNFQEAFLGTLSADAADEILDQVTILHYAGSGRKPWAKRVVPRTKKTLLLWYAYDADARLNTDLFSYETHAKKKVLEKQG